MSEVEGHVTTALDLLASTERYRSEDFPIQTGERKSDVLAAAQVHATLALVEAIRAMIPDPATPTRAETPADRQETI